MKNKTSPYSRVESLGFIASQASRRILRRIDHELTRRGFPISSDQFLVLSHIWDQNGQPQYVLAETLNKDKSSLARLVTGLETLGLVAREPSKRDAREKIVVMTERGRALTAEMRDMVQERLDLAYEGIDEHELAMCKDVLRRFYRNLG